VHGIPTLISTGHFNVWLAADSGEREKGQGRWKEIALVILEFVIQALSGVAIQARTNGLPASRFQDLLLKDGLRVLVRLLRLIKHPMYGRNIQ
jgi:hypothetical protein